MSLTFEVISIKKGFDKEDFIIDLSGALDDEIISEKFENTDKFKFSFSPTFQEAKDIIEIEEIERIID